MKMYSATIKKDALEPRSGSAYYSRQKLLVILLVTLVSVIPLIGISYFSFNYYRNSWIDNTSTELASLADSRREIIELFLADQNNLLAGLIDLYPPEYLSEQPNLEHVFSAINKSGVITDLGVIDQSGAHRRLRRTLPSQLAGGITAGGRLVRARSMRKGRYTSDIFSGFRGVPHFVVAVANPSSNADPAGHGQLGPVQFTAGQRRGRPRRRRLHPQPQG